MAVTSDWRSVISNQLSPSWVAQLRRSIEFKCIYLSDIIEADGRVTISRAPAPRSDLILGRFLNFITTDIERNPHQIQTLSPDLLKGIRVIVDEIDLDLDVPLADEDE